jgi:ribosome biogenesis GTPase
MTLEALGWNSRRQEEFEGYAAEGLVPGRVVGEHRSHYRVATEATELSAGTTGRLRNTAEERSDLPGVGDFVAVRLAGLGWPGTIEAALPDDALVRSSRRTCPSALAANIDVVHRDGAGGDFNPGACSASRFGVGKWRHARHRGQQGRSSQ